jgi:predicted ester cyclase
VDVTNQNREIIKRFVEAGNARDFGALRALVSPTFERHCPATPDVEVHSLDDFVRFLKSDLEAFPDNRVTLTTLVAEGEHVAVGGTYTGTQRGPFGPFPPSGRRVTCEFGGIFRIESGTVAHLRLTWDNLGVLSQLGHLPPSA